MYEAEDKKISIKNDIIESSKAIRKKYKKLKLNAAKLTHDFERKYHPILEPLKELVNTKKDDVIPAKKDTVPKFNENTGEYEEDETELDLEKARQQYHTPAGQRYARQRARELGVYAAKYILYHLSGDNERALDNRYGIRSYSGKWLLGDSTVKINDDKIYINEHVYDGTPGLFELLFMKVPDKEIYTNRDLQQYKTMLIQTSGHKQYYNAANQKSSNKGYKYVHIIKPLFSNENQSGCGMTVGKPIYEYWDDPNELVDRLRLLLSSQKAGNNSHQNEVISIVEELREANYIQ